MKRDYLLVVTILVGLAAAALITRVSDAQRQDRAEQFAEEDLYLNGAAMKRLTLAFNSVAADWYWMRSLQYVGRKIVKHEDTHEGNFELNDLSALGLRLLPSLLKMSATLDPQFMEPYYYGAVILPQVNDDEAILLLNQGIASNPGQWRLYQHIGYIYWQRNDYEKASEIYGQGAKLSGAPPWMLAMSARMKAEGGSRRAARETYLHLYESSTDETVKEMVDKQVMRLDSLDEREAIRRVLSDYAARTSRCATSWRDVGPGVRSARLRLDATTGAPLDPSGMPYHLVKDGCDVDLDENSKVPKQ